MLQDRYLRMRKPGALARARATYSILSLIVACIGSVWAVQAARTKKLPVFRATLRRNKLKKIIQAEIISKVRTKEKQTEAEIKLHWNFLSESLV